MFRRKQRASLLDADRVKLRRRMLLSGKLEDLELGTTSDGKPFRIPASHLDYHTHILGPTSQGKTRFLMQLFKELVHKTDSTVVFVDPLGNAYDMMVDWCYQQNLARRLVLIDPGETRLVCGINPIKPWETNHHLQASVSWDGMRRALGSQDAAVAPLLEYWMCNTLYALISTGLTMHEAMHMLEFTSSDVREGVIARMPQSPERSDWEFIQELTAGKSYSVGRFKLWLEQVRSALLRVRRYSGENEYLRRMLGTQERIVDWAEVLDQRKIVLINLSGPRNPNPVLSDEDSRMLGIQIINSLIQECFRRREAGPVYPVPCYLLVDECHNFVSAEMEKILSAGRQFKLRLILSHQYLHQLMDKKTLDPTVKYAVIGNTLAKIVFGGLGHEEAEEIGRTLYGHLLNPMRVKDEITQWQQLSHIEEVETTVRSAGGFESSGRAESSGQGEVYTDDDVLGLNDQIINKMRSGQLVYSNQGGSSWNEAVSHGLMVVPGEPFEKITSRTFMDLTEQLYEHISRMIRKPQREAVFAFRKDSPVDFRVAEVPDPTVSVSRIDAFKLDVMRALPYYTEPRLIEEEIKDRHAGLVRGLIAPRTHVPRRPKEG